MIRAYVHRFFHCLFGMFTGHQMVTFFSARGRSLGCTCGRVFYRPKP
jgi:hypothetical protein